METAETEFEYVLSDVHLPGRSSSVALGVAEGTITVLDGAARPHSRKMIDCARRLVLPALVEPHVHLDKAYLVREAGFNEDGTLATALQMMHDVKKRYSAENVHARIVESAQAYVSHGCGFLRCHVDVDDECGLIAFEAAVRAKKELEGVVEVQIVAFPHKGTIKSPGGYPLIEDALARGADVVGAFPDVEGDRGNGRRHLHDMAELAARHGRPLDVHLDESDDPDSRFIETLADCAEEFGLQGRVVASHACTFGSYPPDDKRRIIRQLKDAEVSVVVCPQTNLIMGGRTDPTAPRRGIAPAAELLAGDVTVAFGQDNMQDMFCPFGVGNPLQNAHILSLAGHLSAREDMSRLISMTTDRAAKAIGVADYGIADGMPANVAVFEAASDYDAILGGAACTFALHARGGTTNVTVDAVSSFDGMRTGIQRSAKEHGSAIMTRREETLFINNEDTDGAGTERFESVNPSDGQVISSLVEATQADVDAAVAGGVEAQASWWGSDPRRRASVMFDWADLLDAHREEIAQIESNDNGRPIRETRSQSGIISQWFRYFAGLSDKGEGATIPVSGPFLNYTERVPLGVIAAITPWNHPLLIACKKIAPALAAGNSVMLKPSELAPLSVLFMARLGREAGLPAGALQVVTGGGAVGAMLAAHPGISRIDVTGSTRTGKAVAEVAGRTMKQFGGELGGKTPVIVFDDIDIDRAARGVQFSGFIGAGQTCIAGSRILVQESIYSQFVAALATRCEQMVVGMPSSEDTDMGPQITAQARERIERYISSGIADGARLVAGGHRPSDKALENGYFLEPTVLADGDNDMTCAREEIFGPVLLVIPFKTEGEAIAIANDTEFGLGAAVWTDNVARAHRVAKALRSGTIWINSHHRNDPGSPWGGFGNSGIGRENGKDAFLSFTTTKSIWVELSEDKVDWYEKSSESRLN